MVSGVNGHLGVPAVRPVGKASVPEPGNVILLHLLKVVNSAPDQSLRKRLAKTNLAILQEVVVLKN